MGYQDDTQTNVIDPADDQYQQDRRRTAQQAILDGMAADNTTQPVSTTTQVTPTTRYSTTTSTPDNSYTTRVTGEPVDSAAGPVDTGAADRSSQIQAAYQKRLGHAASADQLANSLNDPNYDANLATTTEAKNYATSQNYGDLQAKAAPKTYKVGAADANVAADVAQFIQSKGLKANQSDPVGSMGPIVEYLRSKGINAQVDYTDVNGHSGGILIDGKPYQLIDGSNNWTPLQEWADDSSTGAAPSARTTAVSSPGSSSLFGDSANADHPWYGGGITNQTPSYLSDYLSQYGGLNPSQIGSSTPTEQAANQGSLQSAMAQLYQQLKTLNQR